MVGAGPEGVDRALIAGGGAHMATDVCARACACAHSCPLSRRHAVGGRGALLGQQICTPARLPIFRQQLLPLPATDLNMERRAHDHNMPHMPAHAPHAPRPSPSRPSLPLPAPFRVTFKALFDAADADRSGFLDMGELRVLVHNILPPPQQAGESQLSYFQVRGWWFEAVSRAGGEGAG